MKPDDEPPDPPLLGAVTLAPESTLYGQPEPAPSGVRVGSLVVIAGAPADVGQHRRVADELVIGRVDAGLVLRDGRISRRHARVFREGEDWWVEDLGSTNGTSVDLGDGITKLPGRAHLRDGARIYVGSTVMKFARIDQTEADYLDRIALLAATDALTGLHAAHRFDSLLDEALRVAQLTTTPLAVLMMDLDGLKQVNDRHGHRFGANTIATVGRMLLEAIGGVGEATRCGGDEFCAYLPGADLDRARQFGERFRALVAETRYELDGIAVRVTVSVGVAVHPAGPHEATATAVRDAADAALYRAKRAGKNQVAV